MHTWELEGSPLYHSTNALAEYTPCKSCSSKVENFAVEHITDLIQCNEFAIMTQTVGGKVFRTGWGNQGIAF